MTRSRSRRLVPMAWLVAPLVLSGCEKAPEEPARRSQVVADKQSGAERMSKTTGSKPKGVDPTSSALGKRLQRLKKDGARPGLRPRRQAHEKPVARVPVSPDDPLKGQFTLEQALNGLPKKGPPMAKLETSAGTLECELLDDKAPITVANFVGLARGLRPFKNPEGQWVKKPAYDGTVFHRIIKGFMIQGGDAAGTGKGEPGYVIPDEIWEGARHDERGLLCMANRGPNTNGMQFFITDGSAPHLDGGYTIFGKCKPDAVIEKLASWEVVGDRAVDPPTIEKVSVRRGK